MNPAHATLNGAALASDSLNSLDIKCALVGAGVRYPKEVYDAVAGWARLEPPSNPYACNCLILPGEVAVHLHPNENSRFALRLENGKPVLFDEEVPIAEVTFPVEAGYNQQKTTAGHPFGSIAVLEGRSTLAFFYLWSCDYIKTRETCSFCFQVMADMAGYHLASPSSAEVAEIIAWAVANAGVEEVQLTAGTLFGSQTECRRYADLLRAIDATVGLSRIKSEIYCYLTAPNDPKEVDQIFEAGADRLGHDLHVWNPDLHSRFAPGHARHVTRARQLRALEYIAQKFGPNKAFSAFVAGLEPLEDMVAGAEYLASRGIVPAFSVWMPTPGSVSPGSKPPDLDYYRQARKEFARLYKTYELNPPGAPAGSHVSLCRDIYRNLEAILVQ
jgi:Radical SAM superfamily